MTGTPTQAAIDAAITTLLADSQILHDVVNGSAQTATVTIGSDQVKTLRNAINSIVDNSAKLDTDFSNIKNSLNDPLRVLGLDGPLKSGEIEVVSGGLNGLLVTGFYRFANLTNTNDRNAIPRLFRLCACCKSAKQFFY